MSLIQIAAPNCSLLSRVVFALSNPNTRKIRQGIKQAFKVALIQHGVLFCKSMEN